MKKTFIILFLSLCCNLQSYGQIDLTLELVGYWNFNGDVLDHSGNNNNGIVFGAIPSIGKNGIPNTAYEFNGISDYIKVPNSASINFPSGSFSMYAIVKPYSFYNGPCHGNILIDKGNSDYSYGCYSLRFSDTYSSTFTNCSSPINTLEQNFYPQLYNSIFVGSAYLPYIVPNTWYCLTAVSDGINAKLYVDGALVMTQTLGGPLGINNDDLFFGRKNFSSYPYWFNGAIDEIRLYNRALNIDEVHALCSCSIPPLVGAIANPSLICNGNPTQLNGTGAVNYSWTDGVSNGVPFIPTSTSTYTVTGTDANGCSNTSSVTVNVVNNLSINLVPKDTILCIGDSIQLIASGATNYTWQPTTNINSDSVSNPIVNPTSTATYTVIGTDASGCSGSATVLIDIVVNPKLTLSKSGDVECNNHTIQLSASGATSYKWTPTTFLSSPNSAETKAFVNDPTLFVVTGAVGSCIMVDSIFVDVLNNGESLIFIPSAFSPNADGINDCMHITNNADFLTFNLSIYNRWGELVFNSNNSEICWEGNFKSQPSEQGVYYYYLKAETKCGKILKKGDVTLIR